MADNLHGDNSPADFTIFEPGKTHLPALTAASNASFLAAQVAFWESALDEDEKNSQEGLAKKNNSVYFLRGETYHDHHPQLFVGTMYNDVKNSDAMMYVTTI